MDQDKKNKNRKNKQDENLNDLEIQDTSLDTEIDEESNGIGYEILTVKVTGKF